MKVAFCTPTITRPFQPYLDAMETAIPLLDAAGLDHHIVFETGNPYISGARATMLRKALDAKADVIVFIDHDLSFDPGDLLKLIQTPGDVVGGTYRFKTEPEEYMGVINSGLDGRAIVRDDGSISAEWLPAGFLKVTSSAIDRFIKAYPELTYGPPHSPSVDLFNHGAMDGVWYGEDVAFCKRWRATGGEVWLAPNLDLTHHSADQAFPGNYHLFLRRQPGGDLA